MQYKSRMCNVSFECAIHAWCVRLGACGLCNQKVHSEVARLPWHKIRFFKNGTWLQQFRNQCNCSPKGILEIPTVLAGPIRKESALHPHSHTKCECHKSQDASIWLESNSGGRPAGSGCATAGGSGTARGLASSRRVGNVGRLVIAGGGKALHGEQSILINLFFCLWLICRFLLLETKFFA